MGVCMIDLSREIFKLALKLILRRMHCKEIWIYIFPEKELRGLSPNFHIHVYVSDLYIPTFGPPIFPQKKGRLIRGIAAQFLSWEYLFRIFAIVSLQCGIMKSLSEFQLRISILRLVFSRCLPLVSLWRESSACRMVLEKLTWMRCARYSALCTQYR
jgi:hypothetical protein